MNRIILIIIFLGINAYAGWSTHGPGYQQPEVGQYCPTGFVFDSRNCFLMEAPLGTNAFMYSGGFYHTPLPGNVCQPPAHYDGANCFIRKIPAGYDPFLLGRKMYVGTNNHFVYRSTACPSGTNFDGANCLFGEPNAGLEANIKSGHFTFKKSMWHKCENIDPTSYKVNWWNCGKGQVPAGHSAFVYQNRWYTDTTPGALGDFYLKRYMTDANSKAKILCEKFSPKTNWRLKWAEEFNPKPDGVKCFSSNDRAQCIYETYHTYKVCEDSPTDWSTSAIANLTGVQKARYGGLRDLNKCMWSIHQGYNSWEASENHPLNSRTSDYRAQNIKVEGGVIKFKTSYNPPPSGGYDCGRPITPVPENQMRKYTNKCPHSGSKLMTPRILPWYADHDPNHTNPTKRYVGKVVDVGRIEFRVKIVKMGHGAWPSVWLFTEKANPDTGGGELDALEFIGDMEAGPEMFVGDAGTYGIAHQTIHNWGSELINYPHTSSHKGTPISIGQWNTYAIEFDAKEIRVYLNGCLTRRLVDGSPSVSTTGAITPFKIPHGQNFTLIMGAPASNAPWHPIWYRAWGGPDSLAKPNFKETEMHVDYVRFYKKRVRTRVRTRAKKVIKSKRLKPRPRR